jgi:hypothetical protein
VSIPKSRLADDPADHKPGSQGNRDRLQRIGRDVFGRVGNQFLLRGIQILALRGQPVGSRGGSARRLSTAW